MPKQNDDKNTPQRCYETVELSTCPVSEPGAWTARQYRHESVKWIIWRVAFSKT